MACNLVYAHVVRPLNDKQRREFDDMLSNLGGYDSARVFRALDQVAAEAEADPGLAHALRGTTNLEDAPADHEAGPE